MIAIIKALSWKYRAAGIGILILAAWFYVERQKTQAFEQGKAAGQEKLFNQQLDELNQRTAARNAELDARTSQLSAESERNDAERTRLDNIGRSLNANLSRHIETIRKESQENRNDVVSLPASDLIPRIRAVLDELDAVDRESNAQ